ncbi:hypothetical protein MRB53_040534 [Persea americana]|nr:hypothetical protein MRB53_040534 [Persea americana]
MPEQRQFPSPDSKLSREYVHSAPVTPIASRGKRGSQSYQIPQTEFARDGRSFRQPIDSQPPPIYHGSPRYYESPVDPRYSHRPESSAGGSSHMYPTPLLSNTPYTESGQFPISDHHFQSNYNTPQLLDSPVFDTPYDRRPGYFDDEDSMPDDAYVPSVKTNFPPTRPSNVKKEDSNQSGLESPTTSPDEAVNPTDKKTVYSRWTPEEDQMLKDAISKHGDGKWSLVSACVPGRTPMQCSTRWQGALNTAIHKGRWDKEEDAILIKSVAEWQAYHINEANKEAVRSGVHQDIATLEEELYKNIPWSSIASFLPRSRTGVQALARWSEALDPRITKGKWTSQEDLSLMRGVQKYGKCWIKIANGVRGRTQRQCRTRYCQIIDKKRKMPGQKSYLATPTLGEDAFGNIIPGSQAMEAPDLHFSD